MMKSAWVRGKCSGAEGMMQEKMVRGTERVGDAVLKYRAGRMEKGDGAFRGR